MRSVWGRTAGLHLGAGSRAAARAWSLPSSPCTASVMLPGRGMGRQLAAAGCSEVCAGSGRRWAALHHEVQVGKRPGPCGRGLRCTASRFVQCRAEVLT